MSFDKQKLVIFGITSILSFIVPIFYYVSMYYSIKAYQDNKEYNDKHKNKLNFIYFNLAVSILVLIIPIVYNIIKNKK